MPNPALFWSLALTAPVAIPDLPLHGATIDAFVPTGWEISQRAEGDLDGDGHADTAILLMPVVWHELSAGEEHCISCDIAEWPVAVAVLCADGDGLARCGLNTKGTASDAYPIELEIRGGQLHIRRNGSAGHSMSDTTWHFRWDSGARALRLIGEDSCAGGQSSLTYLSSTNLLTHRQISTTCPEYAA